jgi:putative flippase GtrA
VFTLEKASSFIVVPLRFVLVGLLNTATGLIVIYFMIFVFGIHDLLANVIGYAVGISVSFLLNARWTFSFRGQFGSAAVRFAATNLVGYFANLATVSFFLYALRFDSSVAQATGVLPYALVTYLGSKYFVFRRSPDQEVCPTNIDCSCPS